MLGNTAKELTVILNDGEVRWKHFRRLTGHVADMTAELDLGRNLRSLGS